MSKRKKVRMTAATTSALRKVSILSVAQIISLTADNQLGATRPRNECDYERKTGVAPHKKGLSSLFDVLRTATPGSQARDNVDRLANRSSSRECRASTSSLVVGSCCERDTRLGSLVRMDQESAGEECRASDWNVFERGIIPNLKQGQVRRGELRSRSEKGKVDKARLAAS